MHPQVVAALQATGNSMPLNRLLCLTSTALVVYHVPTTNLVSSGLTVDAIVDHNTIVFVYQVASLTQIVPTCRPRKSFQRRLASQETAVKQ